MKRTKTGKLEDEVVVMNFTVNTAKFGDSTIIKMPTMHSDFLEALASCHQLGTAFGFFSVNLFSPIPSILKLIILLLTILISKKYHL